MAMTLWLNATVGLADAGAFWAGLRLPDVFTVDVTSKKVTRSAPDDPQGISWTPFS